ncbi:LytTR family transcriptional regulator DNA-binding domain-containing protein [Clostridium uliginosum]|uniref:ABC-2 type transport system ATP-binding protein n=1 Tax=Clostridium uliginosum TaxID=119641 RepID=A0A1I1MTH8_9CLOT|nr:LytTR family transcriptional regulator DNA-binding domain-containing protein [Clostridium uliginosum]SFC88747.1 ABC-2 type transport system ATP-binding protein [Clostridium uliginosum]
MLEIKSLYKKQNDNVINNISFKVEKGNLVSIESSSELSDILIKLILDNEVLGTGEIYIEGIKHSEYIKKNKKNIGVVFREEGFYERLTVDEYMKYYSDIIDSKVNYKDVMLKFSLLEIANKKIKTLNYSKRKMLSFAREMLKGPKILIFQDPIFNMDKEGTRIILENIEELYSKGTAVLAISMSFKDTMLIGGKTYILDENGMEENQEKKDEDISELNYKEEKGYLHKVQKIPAKLDEKILLFDPVEIDYIESESGISNLNVRGEKFPCMMSLTELENNLEFFGFFRCHRSYIVNLQKVREVITWTRNSYSLTLDDKQKSAIPLSKGKLAELKNILKI